MILLINTKRIACYEQDALVMDFHAIAPRTYLKPDEPHPLFDFLKGQGMRIQPHPAKNPCEEV